MLVVAFLTWLYISCYILAHDYLLVILLCSFVRIPSCSASLGVMVCIIT
jgi:hypothetical protein